MRILDSTKVNAAAALRPRRTGTRNSGRLAPSVCPRTRARQASPTGPAPTVKTEAWTKPPSAREVHVRLVRKENGQPLVGATVEARFYREGYTDRLATTNAEGSCTIAIPVKDPTFMILGAVKDGFIPLSVGWDEKTIRDGPISPYTFEMIRGTTIGLRVHDEQGKPIAGVKVVPWFMGKIGGSGKERFHSSEAGARTTDAQGRWRPQISSQP